MILAFPRGDAEERTSRKRAMEKLEQIDADLHRALELMRKHGALADTPDRARHCGAMARDTLGLFASPRW